MIFIPLIDTNLDFELIHSVPVPFLSSDHKGVHARIAPEFDNFAVSRSRREFFSMSKERFEICALRGYCYPESAIYIVDRSMANCVLSAFFNMSFSIDDCNVELLRSENLYPYSIRISSKQHLIVTDQLISFTISCNSRVSRQVINPPMGFINLNRGCRATNSNILLLSRTVLNSSAVDTDSFTKFEF